MALCDYILCCKCEGKLIYDGDHVNREGWAERFGKEPEIMCPDCQSKDEALLRQCLEFFESYSVGAMSRNNAQQLALEAIEALKERLK